MQKKVAIIIERANIVLGGAERSVFELATALSTQNCKVHILAAKGQTQAANIHILCKNTACKRTGFYTFRRAVQKHLAENQYDIIHSTLPFYFANIYQPRGGAYAETIIRNIASYKNPAKRAYKKITAFANLRRTKLLCAERKLAQESSGPIIAALSNYVADQFKNHYSTDPNRIKVIHNGIKINRNVDRPHAEKLRSQILAQLKLKEADEPVFFLFVANNFRLKGLRALIEALNLAKKLHLNDRIVFLGAVGNIQNILSITDVAVLPTYYDPASRFILEALAVKKPVITTKFNGATDLFTNNRHGKIIDDPEHTAELAQAICHFSDRNNIQKASENIIADDLPNKISIQRVAKQLVSLYNSEPL
ncbi:MAG: glycosyltransferase family 4 protein [Planctomycetota bacterium]|jgi:glycosyltransferase involved in cell wall biosynthesis